MKICYIFIIQQTYFLDSVRYLIEANNTLDVIIINEFVDSSLVDTLSIIIAIVI